MEVSHTSISIEGFGYSARIMTLGARLAKLKYLGRDLIEPFNSADPRTLYWGELLAPWPNRIADGKYLIAGIGYQLPINEVDRNNALHGLINILKWKVVEQDDHSVCLETKLPATVSYPFNLAFKAHYSLTNKGLTLVLTVTNLSLERAPYGVSIHPYLVADWKTQVDSWSLKLPAHQYLEIDAERFLPVGIRDCDERDFNFTNSRRIGSLLIDHAFKINSVIKAQKITLVGPEGHGVSMSYGPESNWIQIHTADRDGGAGSRSSLAVEPMTCPPNAFNSGVDLIWLEPKGQHVSTWSIEAIL